MTAIWRNASLATLDGQGPDRLLADGALVVDQGLLKWVGAANQIPIEYRRSATEEFDVGGALVTPGLIDCHTHLVYGGQRAREFAMRLEGRSYEAIAREGGGIRSTVAATRQASEDELMALASERLLEMLGAGITTIEIKSGYGLSRDHEARLLRVARRLCLTHAVNIRTTYLAAHAVPPEFEGRADEYMDAVCQWLPGLHAEGLVDAVDAFCDRVAFSAEQTRRLFEVARGLGLPVKLHAEQLSNQQASQLAARFQALSSDHLEYLDPAGVQAMAASGTVAVLLPGAYYFLREKQLPPVPALLDAKVPIAIASDHNPGTCPILSPLLVLNMACVLFGLTPWQALRGMTAHAARALGLGASHGQLAAGYRADFVVWDAGDPTELAYFMGRNLCRRRVFGGAEQGH